MSLTSTLIAAGVAVVLILIARSRNASDSSARKLDSATEADLPALLSAGRKIDAIKVYRRLHGVDLKTAKDAIDRLAAGLPPPPVR